MRIGLASISPAPINMNLNETYLYNKSYEESFCPSEFMDVMCVSLPSIQTHHNPRLIISSFLRSSALRFDGFDKIFRPTIYIWYVEVNDTSRLQDSFPFDQSLMRFGKHKVFEDARVIYLIEGFILERQGITHTNDVRFRDVGPDIICMGY